MSGGPRSTADLLAAWARGITRDEQLSLDAVYQTIQEAIRRAQKVPASIDRRCLLNCVERLEEAEHWALQALRVAIDRDDQARDQEGA